MNSPFESFYTFMDETFSVPSLDLGGIEAYLIGYFIFMCIPLIFTIVTQQSRLLPSIIGCTMIRLFVSPAPIIGVVVALCLWCLDMKKIFTSKYSG